MGLVIVLSCIICRFFEAEMTLQGSSWPERSDIYSCSEVYVSDSANDFDDTGVVLDLN